MKQIKNIPLEIKLIIYEYFDPKNIHVIINNNPPLIYVFVNCYQNFKTKLFGNYNILFKRENLLSFYWIKDQLDNFYWRKSHLDNFYNK